MPESFFYKVSGQHFFHRTPPGKLLEMNPLHPLNLERQTFNEIDNTAKSKRFLLIAGAIFVNLQTIRNVTKSHSTTSFQFSRYFQLT